MKGIFWQIQLLSLNAYQSLNGTTFREINFCQEIPFKDILTHISNDTYKNLLIGSYKRDVVYVKNHQEN